MYTGRRSKFHVVAVNGRVVPVEAQPHPLLTSASDGGEWSNSRPTSFTPEKETSDPLNRWRCQQKSKSAKI